MQQQPRQKLPEPLDLPKQSDSSDYDQRQTVLNRPLSPPRKSGGGFGSLFRCDTLIYIRLCSVYLSIE